MGVVQVLRKCRASRGNPATDVHRHFQQVSPEKEQPKFYSTHQHQPQAPFDRWTWLVHGHKNITPPTGDNGVLLSSYIFTIHELIVWVSVTSHPPSSPFSPQSCASCHDTSHHPGTAGSKQYYTPCTLQTPPWRRYSVLFALSVNAAILSQDQA